MKLHEMIKSKVIQRTKSSGLQSAVYLWALGYEERDVEDGLALSTIYITYRTKMCKTG